MVQTWALSVIGSQTTGNGTQFTPMPRKRMANDAVTHSIRQKPPQRLHRQDIGVAGKKNGIYPIGVRRNPVLYFNSGLAEIHSSAIDQALLNAAKYFLAIVRQKVIAILWLDNTVAIFDLVTLEITR